MICWLKVDVEDYNNVKEKIMNNRKLTSIVLLVAPAWTTSVYAGGVTVNFSSAVGHSVMAVGHSVVGSVSAVASIAALP